jgi:hypothetical protein
MLFSVLFHCGLPDWDSTSCALTGLVVPVLRSTTRLEVDRWEVGGRDKEEVISLSTENGRIHTALLYKPTSWTGDLCIFQLDGPGPDVV